MLKAISFEKKKEIAQKFTKYEVARILGARALQISMNAPVLLKISKEELAAVNYDPLQIAEMELYAGVLPISVRRPFPLKLPERSLLSDKASKKKNKDKDKDKKKKEEKKVVPAAEAPKAKDPVSGLDTAVEEKIIKETEDAEIMELAQPEDEMESTGEASPDEE